MTVGPAAWRSAPGASGGGAGRTGARAHKNTSTREAVSELSSEVRSEVPGGTAGPAGPAGGEDGAPGGDLGPPGRDRTPVPPADRRRRVDAGLQALGGLLAAVAAELVLLVLRATLQVRSVPERVLEWLLLFVPLDVFEAGLRRFGFDAKRYALYGAVLGTLVVLAALGAVALRRRWSVAGPAGAGAGPVAVRDAGGDAPHQRRPVRRRPGQRDDGRRRGLPGGRPGLRRGAGPVPGGASTPARAGRPPGSTRPPARAAPRLGPAGRRRTSWGAPSPRSALTVLRPALRPPPAPARGGRPRPPGADPLRRPRRPQRPPQPLRAPGPRPRAGARPGRRPAPPGGTALDPAAPASWPGTRTARRCPRGAGRGSWPSPSRATPTSTS